MLKLVPLCWAWQIESQNITNLVKNRKSYNISCLLIFIDLITWGAHKTLADQEDVTRTPEHISPNLSETYTISSIDFSVVQMLGKNSRAHHRLSMKID